MSTELASLTSPQAERLGRAGAILAVPLGSTEQHGPHLPLSTDTDVAVALCRRLAAVRRDVIVAPPVAYGASGEHAGFAGTVSIGLVALELLVLELCRSATDTFGRVLIVSAHGGNTVALTAALARLRAESRDVRLYTPRWTEEAHAGAAETGMMLVLDPTQVHMDRAEAGDTRPIQSLMPLLKLGGVRSVSRNGVLGDPRTATAPNGAQLLEQLTDDLTGRALAWFGPISS